MAQEWCGALSVCSACVCVFAVRCVQMLPKRFISVASSLGHKQTVFFLLLVFLLYPVVGMSPIWSANMEGHIRIYRSQRRVQKVRRLLGTIWELVQHPSLPSLRLHKYLYYFQLYLHYLNLDYYISFIHCLVCHQLLAQLHEPIFPTSSVLS